MPKPYRIDLNEIGIDEWVEIPERRSFGTRLRVEDAMTQGLRAFNLTRAVEYIQAWSFVGDITEAALERMDDDIVAYVLNEAEAHYEEVRRKPAERKSVEGAASGSDGVAGDLADDGLVRRGAAA